MINIPYEKEITFSTKIAEVTSISLECNKDIIEDNIEGNFIVSGDYKIHELSVNKEPFNYKLPFSISLSDNMIRDSINLEITNFTYEIIDEDILKVNIDVSLTYDEVEEENTKEIEASRELENLLDTIEKENNINIENNHSEDTSSKEEIKDNTINNDVVLNNVGNTENTYVIYHIHILTEGESIDSVSNKYKVDKDIISEYNKDLEWVLGEKVIVPQILDE